MQWFPLCKQARAETGDRMLVFRARQLIRIFFTGAVAAVVVAGAVQAGEAGPLKNLYHPEQVSAHVYVIHGPTETPNPANQGFMNNPGFVLTEEGVVVIDPGSSLQIGRMVVAQIETVTDMPIVATIATHIHGDHWLANQAILERYPEAKMYAHPDLIERARSGEADAWLDLLMRLTDGATEGTVAMIPDLPLEDGDILKFGEIEFSIHHRGQAHTHSDIALVMQPDNIMFTGDLVTNERLGRMDEGHFSGLVETLDYLSSIAPDVVVPGHGQTGNVSIIEDSRRLHHLIYQTIKQKFDEGLSDFEIKPFVVEQLDGFRTWTGFDDGIGRMISQGYLEVEEDSF